MATAKKVPVLVVTETHRFPGLGADAARFIAAFVNETGKTVTDEGFGIYDMDPVTTYEATLETDS